MKVLLVGQGGREHALAKAIVASPRVDALVVQSGNPGLGALGDVVELDPTDHAQVLDTCRRAGVDLVIVGPEVPLVAGLADALAKAGIAVFGPSAAAARLEGSKAFTKALCDDAGIPTARYAAFDALDDALEHLRREGTPIVVKADGLAAGKGVTVAEEAEAAEAALRSIFEEDGASVVLEERLNGEEASVFCICDGEQAVPLPPCQDHKRIGEGDTGPNTGGMGALCPAPVVDGAVLARTMERIVRPTLREMVRRGTPFRGVLYAGLMIEEGDPRLIEYNVRFGDPEAQVLAPLLGARLLDLMEAAAHGRLDAEATPGVDGSALCVTLASAGYPATSRVGDVIVGIDDAEAMDGVSVLHAGTERRSDGTLVTNGGRVLTVVGTAGDLREARARAYRGVDVISWDGMQARRDIGHRALGE